MRFTTVLTLIFSVILISTTVAFAAEAQTKCPVMGGKINKEVYVDYQGSRVYFCCPGCKETFLKDPASHIEKMNDEGVVIDKTPKPQTKCPVMGGDINKEVFVDHQGKRVYFCCPACIDKFKADPEKYLKKLKDQGINLEDAPISGEDDSSQEENN